MILTTMVRSNGDVAEIHGINGRYYADVRSSAGTNHNNVWDECFRTLNAAISALALDGFREEEEE